MAAKKIQIDWEIVDELCKIQCTGEEIADVLGCSYDTLERRCKEVHKTACADYIKKKAAGGKSSLRRMQYKAAEGGNATMLIWLGKQYLGQSDKVESKSDVNLTTGSETLREAIESLEDAYTSTEEVLSE